VIIPAWLRDMHDDVYSNDGPAVLARFVPDV
jgi:hypothetical protein